MSARATFLICLLLMLQGIHATAAQERPVSPPEGRYIEKYPNGKTKIKGFYRDGQKRGNWFYYTEKGIMQKREYYRKGMLRATYLYNERGQLITIIDDKGNERHRSPCDCS